MAEIPEGARHPEDHRLSDEELDQQHADDLAEDEVLADMPTLVPPTKLRVRQRNKVMKLAIGLRSFVPEKPEGADGDEVEGELDLDSLSDDQLEKFLDVLADIDDFAESIAVDKEAYVAWSEGQDYDAFTAILGRYSSAVGKSSSSSI
jgi:hypothetical protein